MLFCEGEKSVPSASCIRTLTVTQISLVFKSHCLSYMSVLSSLTVHIYPIDFTVVPTETCPLGSSNTIIVNERNREHEKQEAWLLMELQKLRRQIEASEIRMVQRAPLGVDQGAVHDFSVRIKDLEVTLDVSFECLKLTVTAEPTAVVFLMSWERHKSSARNSPLEDPIWIGV